MHTTEWPIAAVSKSTGLTSRTLRHYEQIGLLTPARVAANGYRFYGEAELARLYRILSLRSLELPLETIKQTLADDTALTTAITAHLALLQERQQRTAQQITRVRDTLDALQNGDPMTIDDLFAGNDNAQYESEVRLRWGDGAWERSAARRTAMSPKERRFDDERSTTLTAALSDAASAGVAPESAPFQALIAQHHQWVTDHWGGRAPDQGAYAGLAAMYVEDERFAAAYGGQANAERIREAIMIWIATNLTD